MDSRQFWSGFVAGAATVLGGAFVFGLTGRGGRSHIVRLEKSIQIARPVQDVFESWCELQDIPRYTSLVRSVQRWGDRSHWVAELRGQVFEWDAEIVQVIPNQSIGWKSVGGMKNSGRITFAPLADQTLVHVQMNYSPSPWFLRPVVSTISGELESNIEQVLRDFKAALESGRGRTTLHQQEATPPTQATGTFGPTAQNPRFGTPTIPVEFTRPPESKR